MRNTAFRTWGGGGSTHSSKRGAGFELGRGEAMASSCLGGLGSAHHHLGRSSQGAPPCSIHTRQDWGPGREAVTMGPVMTRKAPSSCQGSDNAPAGQGPQERGWSRVSAISPASA